MILLNDSTLHEVPEQAKLNMVTIITKFCGGRWRGSVTGKGQEESDRTIPYFDPYLPQNICENEFQMN